MATNDGVIFDKDGVLLDSRQDNPVWRDRVRAYLLTAYGYSLDVESYNSLVRNLTPANYEEELSAHAIDPDDLLKIERAVQARKRALIRQGDMTLYPEVGSVIDTLSEWNIPMAIVSNASHRTIEMTVEHFGLEDAFEYVIGRQYSNFWPYIHHAKPRTPMVDAALETLDVTNPVMVGDSLSDLQAARNSGIDPLYIKRGTNTITDAQETVITDLTEVLEYIDR